MNETRLNLSWAQLGRIDRAYERVAKERGINADYPGEEFDQGWHNWLAEHGIIYNVGTSGKSDMYIVAESPEALTKFLLLL